MRVTREKLINLARTETENRAANGDVISGYIIGSVASGNPILGGTADVDLVLIHDNPTNENQEIFPLSEEYHLDITHHFRELYDRPTDLRIDPWLGPTMCEPIFLYDPHHFFERAQAGVRGRFHRTDYVHKRAQSFLSRAREIKSNLRADGKFIPNYLRVVAEGTNAVATLAGFPAAGRRLVLILESRLEKAEGGRFFERFLQLHGANRIEEDQIISWLAHWDRCKQDTIDRDDLASTSRHRYYFSGLEALLSQGRPEILLWNLLDRWNDSILLLDMLGTDGSHQENWDNALVSLGLDKEEETVRSEELEIYLDDIEEFLEAWGVQHGA